jgi:hypothetical protein
LVGIRILIPGLGIGSRRLGKRLTQWFPTILVQLPHCCGPVLRQVIFGWVEIELGDLQACDLGVLIRLGHSRSLAN